MSTILIVDACDASRELAAELLEQCGLAVLEAEDADAGFSLLISRSVDLALIHPEVGLRAAPLTRRLLELASGQGIPVLAWTDSPEQMRRLAPTGACDLVPRLAGTWAMLVGAVTHALTTGCGSAEMQAALRECVAAF